ncbi:MAG: gamma-glutamyl-gamma-aminobutyrate hydrolase family protein [Candidatus Doudnabacteria bacterium]|nr:gamma-glutamyl-gamma-aminobutyrate hydrolase family protein [Candidatus Doudnabacteria bacterium]
MKTLLIDNGSKYTKKLQKLCAADKTIDWQNLDIRQCANYDLIILSGGHLFPVVSHEKDFKDEIKLIKRLKKPIIGICLGSELIAHAYGASLVRMNRKKHGEIKIRGKGGVFNVYESHRWAIKKLPANLVEIARSKDGVEIFRHKTKPIVGIQFHPEVLVSKTSGRNLFQNILNTLSSS